MSLSEQRHQVGPETLSRPQKSIFWAFSWRAWCQFFNVTFCGPPGDTPVLFMPQHQEDLLRTLQSGGSAGHDLFLFLFLFFFFVVFFWNLLRTGFLCVGGVRGHFGIQQMILFSRFHEDGFKMCQYYLISATNTSPLFFWPSLHLFTAVLAVLVGPFITWKNYVDWGVLYPHGSVQFEIHRYRLRDIEHNSSASSLLHILDSVRQILVNNRSLILPGCVRGTDKFLFAF